MRARTPNSIERDQKWIELRVFRTDGLVVSYVNGRANPLCVDPRRNWGWSRSCRLHRWTGVNTTRNCKTNTAQEGNRKMSRPKFELETFCVNLGILDILQMRNQLRHRPAQGHACMTLTQAWIQYQPPHVFMCRNDEKLLFNGNNIHIRVLGYVLSSRHWRRISCLPPYNPMNCDEVLFTIIWHDILLQHLLPTLKHSFALLFL